ncbi:hypothetical protein [Glycomyces salinus]|uniref:hypothetical protein n=1 Tax=Glycomyces salinus TaxID=980294 RepID=UPI0018EC4AD0|nr:hypothetical protein [Glycomyces salinus]
MFVLTLNFVLIAGIVAVSIERDDRALAGVAEYAGTDAKESEIVLVESRFDNLENSRQFEVHYFTPLGVDAPLPPGLDRWPEPGQVYLSPALFERGADESIAERFGDFEGFISNDGLIDQGELLAYVRPQTDLRVDDKRVDKVIDWGSDGATGEISGIHWLAKQHDFSVAGLIAFIVVALVLPSLALTLVSARIAARRRDRREHLVSILGGMRKHLRWIALGESFPSIGIGFCLALVVMVFVLAVGLDIPVVGFEVSAEDLRSHILLIVGAASLSLAIAAAIVLGLARRTKIRRDSSRLLSDQRLRRMSVIAGLFPVSLAVGVFLPRFFAYTPSYMILQWVGTIGVLLTLPATLGLLTARAGRLLANRGRRRQDAVLLVAGSHLQAQPRETARYITGLAMGLVLFFLVLAYQGILAGDTEEAMQYREYYGTNTILVRTPDAASIEELRAFAAGISEPVEVLAIRTEDRPGSTSSVIASCETLQRLDIPCEKQADSKLDLGKIDALIGAWSSGPKSIVVEDPSEAVLEGATFLLVNPERSQIEIPEVKLAANEFNVIVAVEAPGRGWLIGSMPHYEQAEWVMLFGMCGLAIIGAVSAVASAGRFFAASSRLAPLTAIAGMSSQYYRISAWLVAIPIGLTAVMGTIIGMWIVRPLTIYATKSPGWSTAGVAVGVVLISGIVMWYWASRIAIRDTERWRPGSHE